MNVTLYHILELDNRKGRGAQAEQSNGARQEYKLRSIAKRASLPSLDDRWYKKYNDIFRNP
jgi:hypothetical protein